MTAMKKLFAYVRHVAGVLAIGLSLGSCVSENPFDSTDGSGILRINTVFRSDVSISTRADGGYTQETLGNNLVVYIEGESSSNPVGIVRKYHGLNNIPSTISLKEGKYVVEAWAGDSVSASWDKKFFRAWKETDIKASDPQSLTLQCNIANVLVSVVPESVDVGLQDLTISFWHSRKGTNDEYVLTFDEDKIREGAKGYFMMPTVDHSSGAKEKEISYKLTGKTEDGSAIVKEGVISNVEAAHEYKLSVVANLDDALSVGGALVRLDIIDIPVLESTFDIIPAPTYEASYGGNKFDISHQVDLTTGNIYDYSLTTVCYGGCSSMMLTFSENFNEVFKEKFDNLSGSYQVHIINDVDARNKLNALGLHFGNEQKMEPIVGSDNVTIVADEIELKFTADLLKKLPISDSEYTVEICTIDGGWSGRPDDRQQLESKAMIRFANSDACLEKMAPLGVLNMNTPENCDYTAITTTEATLYGELYSDEVTNYGISYSVKDANSWNDVLATGTRASGKVFFVNLTGLTPGTTYKYKVFCDDYREEISHEFTTESKYEIPNAGLEEWSNLSSNNKVLIPAAGGTVSFWDTGNHGSVTMSKLVTNQSTSMYHGGSSSAELKSQFVGIGTIGKFAAGNLFVGAYVRTDGTDGVLSFGREYNGSHPKALTLYANYRPRTATSKGANSQYIAEGATDQGQIYVALTNGPVEIRTKKDEQKLFDPKADYVVAYGQVTWTDNFGADGSLDKVTIPLEYTERAKTTKPTHLVIVCSASKYGDYFCGGEGSLLYVDDFELEY